MTFLIDPREGRKSAKPIQAWVGGRYEDTAVVLLLGAKYFGGFSGKTDISGKSMVKVRNGLAEAKLIWGLSKVRDYVRRLRDRGYDVRVLRVIIDKEIRGSEI